MCDIGSILHNWKTFNLQLEEQTPAFNTSNASLPTEWASEHLQASNSVQNCSRGATAETVA